MTRYLFVHFREKKTPDGEQVYFALSRDAFHWEALAGGKPVLTSDVGEKGVRDHTIARLSDGSFVILSTDLSLAGGFESRYGGSWKNVSEKGSPYLVLWRSEDLVSWSPARLINPDPDSSHIGCRWAPDIIRDERSGEYILHWSAPDPLSGYRQMRICCARTKDFVSFGKAEILFSEKGHSYIDSAVYRENGRYYLFVKSERNPGRIVLLSSDQVTGPWEKVEGFRDTAYALEEGKYEAPTACRTPDGRWLLFLDCYASPERQGYVPFIADSLKSGAFRPVGQVCTFPYGFKHGTILPITQGEYDRLKAAYGGR